MTGQYGPDASNGQIGTVILMLSAAALGACASALVYVLLAFDGLRVTAVSYPIMKICVGIVGLSFVAACADDRRRVWAVLAVSLLSIFGFFAWSIAARLFYIDLTPIFLLSAFIFTVSLGARPLIVFAVSAAVAFPIIVLEARSRQVEPLIDEFRQMDLQDVCLVRAGMPLYRRDHFESAIRIERLDEIRSSLLGGETAPRYFLKDGEETFIWRYVEQKFERLPKGKYKWTSIPDELWDKCSAA